VACTIFTVDCIFNLIKKFNRSKNCLKQKDRLEMDKQQIMMGMMPAGPGIRCPMQQIPPPGCPMRQVTPYSPNTRRDLAARGELTLEVPSLATLCDEHGQPKRLFSDVFMIADLEWFALKTVKILTKFRKMIFI
jgi:hypothetical protein